MDLALKREYKRGKSIKAAVFRSRLEQKNPVTKCLVYFVCVLFSMAKSMLRMGSCVRFCCPNDHNISFLRTMCGEESRGVQIRGDTGTEHKADDE